MRKIFERLIFLSMFVFALSSCQSEMDKYYSKPGSNRGNAWDIMQKAGNFTIFLAGIEKSGYKELVNGKGIITIAAPNDDAFRTYLSSKGYSSINDMPLLDLKKLITFHLMYYSFDKETLAAYNPYGTTTLSTSLSALSGLYYKFRTKSKDTISLETDATINNKIRKVYHKERFLPILSTNFFTKKGIDASANYQFFYPSSTWSGGTDGFNISNAVVSDYAIPTDNGYIYNINQVITPLETIEKNLKTSSDFSDFLSIYNRFALFYYDASATSSYGNGDTLYVKQHYNLPYIASEWSYNGESSMADYADLATLSYKAFNVFAPNNTAIESFFNSFWKGYYNSLSDVNYLPLLYLLNNHSYSGSLVFPEEIENGKITNSYGTAITFNRSTAQLKTICCNGSLYGIDHVITPPMFTSVTRPLFQDPQYNMFLMMLDKASLIQPLMSSQTSFTLFAPNDNDIQNYTSVDGQPLYYVVNNSGYAYYSNGQIVPGQVIQTINSSGAQTNMTTSAMTSFADYHIATKIMSNTSSGIVYKTLSSYNYLLQTTDGKLYSSWAFNNGLTPPSITKISDSNVTNGTTYALSNGVSALVPDNSTFKNNIFNSRPSDLNAAYTALSLTSYAAVTSSGVVTTPAFNFTQGGRFIVFLPTATACAAATNSTNNDATYYFVDVNTSGLADYPFPGAGIQGTLTTYKTANGSRVTLKLIDTGTGLQLQDVKGNTVNVVSSFPRIYGDGAVYMIDGYLSGTN